MPSNSQSTLTFEARKVQPKWQTEDKTERAKAPVFQGENKNATPQALVLAPVGKGGDIAIPVSMLREGLPIGELEALVGDEGFRVTVTVESDGQPYELFREPGDRHERKRRTKGSMETDINKLAKQIAELEGVSVQEVLDRMAKALG